ncbi:MAG: hypothetical protein GX971_13255 [Firmicutes bacterium]|nr:hypothetical protein [Bacillota bacterium]
MIRKSLLMALVVVVLLSSSMVVFAQEYWAWNTFNAQEERFKYEVVSRTSEWDYEVGEEVWIENRQYQTLELRRIDDSTYEVTTGYTFNLPSDELGDKLSFMGGTIGLSMLFGAGDWFGELMMLGFFASDLELEVGNSMQTFDGSRIKVVEKMTVAGVDGYFATKHRRDTDESGGRVDILTSEWVFAPDVGWPLLVRIYEEDQVVYSMELVEYSRK